jgi:competence protein ComEC
VTGAVLDARLLAPAAGLWIGAAATGLVLDRVPQLEQRYDLARIGLLIALATLIGALLALVVLVRNGWRARSHREGAIAMSIGLGAVLAGVAAACLPVVSSTAPPIGGWIDGRVTAIVEGVVTGESVTRDGVPDRPDRPWTEVRMRASRITARGSQHAVDLSILVRADGDSRSPPPGSVVVVTGRLAPIPLRTGIAASLALGSGDWEVRAQPGTLDTAAHDMRVGLRQSLAGTPPDAGSLVAGLAVGDESEQPAALGEAMRASGLSHLTAVSGGNVAVVIGVVLGLTTLLRLPLAARAVAALLALGYFVLLVGPQPSVLRAAAMGVAAVVGIVVGGRRAGPAVVSAAVIVLLVVAPWLAVSWGFALSAFATAGLVLIAPMVVGRLETARHTSRWPPGLQQAIALTAAAQLATLPLLVAMGGAVGWVALPANLLAMPAVPPVTVLGLAAAAVSPVQPAIAATIAHVAAWPAAWIAGVAHACAGLPAATLPLPSGWLGVLLLAVLGLTLVVLRRVSRHVTPEWRTGPARAVLVGFLMVSAVVLVAWPPDRRGWPPPDWLVLMCDVGQGDALLLHAGPGQAVLVDAGPDPVRLDACLDDAGITTVPLVLLTHFHADHARGLDGAFRGREVSMVAATPVQEPHVEAEAVQALVTDHDLVVRPVSAGSRLRAGDVDLTVLWPRRRITSGSVPNNASVVAVASIRGRNVLLAGDIEPEAQAAIAADLPRWRFAAVKVPHHGSRYQAQDLPAWARAPVALVSVGADNDYGHPDPGTIAAWERAGAWVLRTDRDGDVALVATGSGAGVVTRGGMLPSP